MVSSMEGTKLEFAIHRWRQEARMKGPCGIFLFVWTGVATTQDKNLQLSLRRISEYLIATFHNGGKGPKEREVPGIGLHY